MSADYAMAAIKPFSFQKQVLDLINGHLITHTDFHYDYVPLDFFAFNELVNWYVYKGWDSDSCLGLKWLLTIHDLGKGGFECTVKLFDMHKFGRFLNTPVVRKKREKVDKVEISDIERDIENKERSIKRSIKKIRHLIKVGCCDRLVTLTKRESVENKFWTVLDWKKAFQRFIRLLNQAGICFQYICVIEPHKKGNYHLHLAIDTHIHINTVRQIWWSVCGGRGMGNVDVRFYQHRTYYQRICGVARYVSKYISKQIGHIEFNKKRYWSSRKSLIIKPVRVLLNALDFRGALHETCRLLGLSWKTLKKGKNNFFSFSGGGGFFLSFLKTDSHLFVEPF